MLSKANVLHLQLADEPVSVYTSDAAVVRLTRQVKESQQRLMVAQRQLHLKTVELEALSVAAQRRPSCADGVRAAGVTRPLCWWGAAAALPRDNANPAHVAARCRYRVSHVFCWCAGDA